MVFRRRRTAPWRRTARIERWTAGRRGAVRRTVVADGIGVAVVMVGVVVAVDSGWIAGVVVVVNGIIVVVVAERRQRAGCGQVLRVMMERTDGARASGWSWQTGQDSRVEAIGQWFLERSRGRSMPIVHVGGGRRRRLAAAAAAAWCGAGANGTSRVRVWPGANVGWAAVQALECGVVAGLGEQLQADGCLAFPFGSAIQTKRKGITHSAYKPF